MKPGKTLFGGPSIQFEIIFQKTNSSLAFLSMNITCIFQFFTTWILHFKNNEKIPGNVLENPGKIMKF